LPRVVWASTHAGLLSGHWIGAFLAAIAHNRVPQAVGFGLIVSRNLERKGLDVLERRATVQAETRDGWP
jgi:hypothetical protein